MENKPDITYWDYLKLEKILTAQGGVDNESSVSNDELHFIIIHQVFELWFKLAIKELRFARDVLNKNLVNETDIPTIVQHIRRVNEIFKLDQFTLLETMTPQDFLFFREKLGTASGFQSIQMRELEMLLGLKRSNRVPLGSNNVLDVLVESMKKSPHHQELTERLQKTEKEFTLKDGLLKWLSRTPVYGVTSQHVDYNSKVDEFLADYYKQYCALQDSMANNLIASAVDKKENIVARFDSNKKTAELFLLALDEPENERNYTKMFRAGLLFIESYRNLPLLAWPRQLLDTIVELEQLVILFRSRHARMVERMIGRRVGTGGSSGVDYLDETTKYRIFTDLWTVRTLLLPEKNLPELKNKEFYDFVTKY
jgi:tryptophan 2,3-dioxygenase